MTTPPPVGETTPAPAEALLQRSNRFHHLLIDPVKHDVVSLARLQRALTEMVNAVWVDPQSQKALGTVHELLQEDGLMEQDPEATPVPTVELGADQVDQMNQNSNDNLAAFEMLKGKAEEALSKMREAEATEQHNHDLRIQSLMQAIQLAEDKTEDAKRDHARISEEKADAEHELVETQASKAADEKTLAGLKHECDEGATNWDTRQKEAKAEQAAIMKAKDILASRVTVLVQQGAKGQEPVDVAKFNAATQRTREVLIDHFRMLGSELHSIAMLNLVSVASSEPMAQVKGLLKDLIGKLTKEAAEAASLHEFCKEEKTKTAEAKDKKNDLIDKLETRLDKATSKSTSLKEKIATLSEEIAASEKAVAEATKIRTEENAFFVKQEADYKEAADAVEDAIDALKDYYGDASLVQSAAIHVHHTAALVQNKEKAPPALGGAKSEASGGILSIMSTMQAEFRKEVSKLQSEEREAVKTYDTFVHDSKVAKAAKSAEIKAAKSEVKSLTVAIKNIGEDHKLASNELASILEYISKLKPQCEGRTVSYADRKAKRDAEIQGLKEALSIIEKDAPASFLQIRA